MAWTVAFALLGALDLFDAGCSGAGEPFVPLRRERMEEPRDELSDGALQEGCHLDNPQSLAHGGSSRSSCLRLQCSWPLAESSDRNSCLIWMRARFGFAVPWLPAPGLRKAHGSLRERVRCLLFSRGPSSGQPDRASRRWDRHDGIFRHGIFRRPFAKGKMASGLSPKQRPADRRDGSRAGKDTGSLLGFLSADFGQSGRGRERR